MLKRLSGFLFGFVAGALFMFLALKYHLVRADDGLHMIPKAQATLSGAYVDIREFSLSDWQERPELALAINQAGKTELLTDSGFEALRGVANDLLNRLGE